MIPPSNIFEQSIKTVNIVLLIPTINLSIHKIINVYLYNKVKSVLSHK